MKVERTEEAERCDDGEGGAVEEGGVVGEGGEVEEGGGGEGRDENFVVEEVDGSTSVYMFTEKQDNETLASIQVKETLASI